HALLRHPDVVDCAVFGVPCDEYGERLVAVVQTENTGLQAEPVIDWLRGQIAGFKIPRQIEFTTALPRDDNGKIAKRRLRDALVRHRELPMPALGEALMRELADYQGGQLRRDDLTVFGFRL
ncbi:hypothetical protein ABTK62_19805, partial [Acinetobacter baumannii]